MEKSSPSVLNTLQCLDSVSKAGKVKELQNAREALLSHLTSFEGCIESLEEKAGNSDENVQLWVCETYKLATLRFPTVTILTSGLKVAAVLLTSSRVALLALEAIYAMLLAIFKESEVTFSDSKLWDAFHEAAEAVSGAADSGPVSLKISAMKLLERFLLLLTSSVSAQLGREPKYVAAQVQKLLKQQMAWVRAVKSGQQASAVSIVALESCSRIVLRRPNLAGRILPSILALAGLPDLSTSFKKCLKRELVSLLAAEALQAWKSKTSEALRKLGVKVDNPWSSDVSQAKKGATEPANQVPEPEHQQDPQHASAAPAQMQQQQPQYYQSHHAGALQQSQHLTAQNVLPQQAQVAAPGAGEERTLQAEIDQVLAIVAALLADNDQPTCIAFVNGLPPAVLADVVISNMARLPRKEDIVKADATANQGSGNALLAGLMQATAQPNGEGSTAAAPGGGTSGKDQVAQAAPGPAGTPTAPVSQVPLISTQPFWAAQPEKKAVAVKPKPPPVAIKLQPLALTEAQQASAGQAALRRLIRARNHPCQQLQGDVIAHIGAHIQDQQWTDALLKEVVETRDQGGYDLALKWLYAVFTATTLPPGDFDSKPGAEQAQPAKDSRANSGRSATGSGSQLRISEVYDRCLQRLLDAFRTKVPAKDRSIARLLVEAPALSDALLGDALKTLVFQGGEFATLALIAARDVVMLRPANRSQALQAMLQMAVSIDQDVRAKAVRLIANKLFPNILFTATIEQFAAQQLRELCQDKQGSKRGREEEQVDDQDASEKRQRTEEPVSKDATSNAAEGGDMKLATGSMQDTTDGEEEVHLREPKENARRAEQPAGEPDILSNGDAPGPHAPTTKPPNTEPPAAAPGTGDEPDASLEETPEEAARHCELYCALCTKRHVLLRDLFEVFGKSHSTGRTAILKNAEGLARVLGPSAPALVALVMDPPSKSETLLLRMLYFLTETQLPPQVLVDACQHAFEQRRDASFLPPALAGMTRDQIVTVLPKLLEPVSLLSASMARILLPQPSGESKMTATEVLLALHSINPSKEGIRLKQVMGALDWCIAQRNTFDKEVLASALQQLTQRQVLPPLYMRFLMQSQAHVPELKGFMMEQLAALVSRQIWTNKTLFTGWNLAVRQNVPDSFPAFLQLPSRILSETLQSAPEDFKEKLKAYADSAACPSNQRKPIMKLLETVGNE